MPEDQAALRFYSQPCRSNPKSLRIRFPSFVISVTNQGLELLQQLKCAKRSRHRITRTLRYHRKRNSAVLCIDTFHHLRHCLQLWQSIKIEFPFSSCYLRALFFRDRCFEVLNLWLMFPHEPDYTSN
jgi:hypothetical protein